MTKRGNGKLNSLNIVDQGYRSDLNSLLSYDFIFELKDALPRGIVHKLYANDHKLYMTLPRGC